MEGVVRLLSRYGDIEHLRLKRNVTKALNAGAGPEAIAMPDEIARRQTEGAELVAKGDTFNNMGWVFAYDPVTEWRTIPA